MNKKNKELIKELQWRAYQARVDVIRATTKAGSGHVSSCMSATEIGVALFFYGMRFDVLNLRDYGNDRCIFSKGHAAPLLYALWKQKGLLSDEQLMTLRQYMSPLEGHPNTKWDGVDVPTGSLGCGLSMGLGMRLASRMDGRNNSVYVLLGDSECTEGSVWEAVQLAAYYNVEGLVAVIDVNGLGQRGKTIFETDVHSFEKRFNAFGWHTITVDGHSFQELLDALDESKKIVNQPVMIIAKTIKGKGIPQFENKNGFHGVALKPAEIEHVLCHLKEQNEKAGIEEDSALKKLCENQVLHNRKEKKSFVCEKKVPMKCGYTEPTAPRRAYGDALESLKKRGDDLMVFDAEVGNSTYAQTFAQLFPACFIESFIAEQNMVGMAIGAASQGKQVFVSTFGAFLTRAFDFIRMAGIGAVPIRLVGTHCGVSVGQDGPSQMALEDIAMIATVPESVILYPSDAVSAFALVQLIAQYEKTVSYIRLTREVLPLIYDQKAIFEIGKCSVLIEHASAQAVIVAAGITVHEALKAAKIVAQKGILVSVIDLYSVKPFDVETVRKVAEKSNNMIITVEDHYVNGGMGHMVAAAFSQSSIQVKIVAVTQVPCSGTPEQLRAMAGIDADALVKALYLCISNSSSPLAKS